MRVLVTGAHGFIGSHLAERLLAEGFEVRGLVSPWGDTRNLSAVLGHPGLELVRSDITEPETLRGVCRGVEVVFHAAARVAEWGPWEPFFEANVKGTENLLWEAERGGVRRFVLVSSVAVHRYTGFRDADPRALPLDGDVNAYARSKVMAERLVMGATGLEPVAVRPGLLPFGPRDPHLARQLPALKWGLPPLVNGGRSVFNPAYVGNFVDGLVLAGTVPDAAGHVYVIADEGTPSWREWFETLAALTASPKPWLSLPKGVAMRLGSAVEESFRRVAPKRQPPLSRYMAYLVKDDVHFSTEAARKELGYLPRVGWQEGLRRTLERL